MYDLNIRRLLIGKPLKTNDAIHQRLNKAKALAVFSSDALSSSAYATEAILLVLIAAGTGALSISMPIALLITSLLLVVAFSYYQTIHAYPNGGGAYIVSKDNLGAIPGLTAAASLLIDYILTVAVSVSAGVAALTSAFPELLPLRIILALAIVVFVTVMNLRGVKESGTFFAIPTYAFIVGVFTLIGIGLFRVLTGAIPEMSPEAIVAAEQTTETAVGSLSLFLLLRAFAAGCTALTGVEAISNGIPAFRPPESRNAGQTLIIMVVVLSSLFVGITFLANSFPIVVSEHGESTVLSQLAREVFGGENVLFFYLQFATLFILSLAANTAFADFPRLASLIAADRYLPRQLTNIGDRLVFHNGIISLAVVSSILIILFDAREHRLLPLYAVGVFISFTLSQSGMVRHWLKERAKPDFKMTSGWYFKLGMNAFGAVATFIVGMILMITKFAEGAWIVIVTIPLLMFLFTRIHKHYETVAKSLTLDGLTPGPLKRVTSHVVNQPVVVLMNSLNRSSLQALEYALTLSDNVRVCTIGVDDETVDRLRARWEEWDLGYIPLDIVSSPYREVGTPLIEYLHQLDKDAPHVMPTMVVLPQFVVLTWWENLLHNQTSNTIRDSLLRDQIATGRGRAVIDVPYHIGGKLFQPVTLVEEASEKVAPVSN